MSTWWRGRRILAEKRARETMPLETFVEALKPDHPPRVAGTAVIMARDPGQVPTALLHALKHYKVLHERIVLMSVLTRDVPHVGDDERLELRDLGKGVYTLRLWYGFMDEPNILRALAQCRIQRLPLQPDGDVVHHRPRKAGAGAPPPAVVAMAQAAFHPDVEHRARRDRVLPDTRRTGSWSLAARSRSDRMRQPVMMRVRAADRPPSPA